VGRYAVYLKPSAERVLKRLPVAVQKRIVVAVEALSDEPRPVGVVKLSGAENLWRIRVGNHRVAYEIHDDRLLVLVLRVAHRRDVYRRRR
jgi:mRNA interferase RelE/StbE